MGSLRAHFARAFQSPPGGIRSGGSAELAPTASSKRKLLVSLLIVSYFELLGDIEICERRAPPVPVAGRKAAARKHESAKASEVTLPRSGSSQNDLQTLENERKGLRGRKTSSQTLSLMCWQVMASQSLRSCLLYA
jgi:hypothetical protein